MSDDAELESSAASAFQSVGYGSDLDPLPEPSMVARDDGD